MKIKTSSLSKTAPSPPPMAAEAGQPQYPSARRGRKCCATWTGCDIALLVILLLGISAAVIFPLTMRCLSKMKGHSLYYGPEYYPSSCKVSKIVKEGEVCCGETCDNGKQPLKNDLINEEWYKFKDEISNPSDMDHRMEEWEEIEEFERKQWEKEREWMKGRGEGDDMEDDDDEDETDSSEEKSGEEREKRSARAAPQSFTCYKIVIESQELDVPEYQEFKEGRDHSGENSDSSSEESDSSEEEEDWHRRPGRGGHHGSHGGRKGHRGGHSGHHGHHDGHRSRRQAPGHEEREGERKAMEEERKRRMEEERERIHGDDRSDEESDEWEPMSEEGRDENFHPESGVVVVGDDNDEEKGIYHNMFYDTEYTAREYSQCSYSACTGRRCRSSSTVDIEQKMKKWFAREQSGESFNCYHADHDDHGYVLQTKKYHFSMRIAHKLFFPFIGFLITIFIILVVKRCRACKQRCAAARAARAAAATPTAPAAPEKYIVPDTDGDVKLTKEQEANLPPTPRMVWTTELPDYDKASEQPPEYKSSPDLNTQVKEENEVTKNETQA